MKMSQNRWTAGNALSWALGVTLGLIVGIALLIAIPRMMSTPTTSAESPEPPAAVAQTGDSSGAATTTEQPGATDPTGMASGQTSGSTDQSAAGAMGNESQTAGTQNTGTQGSEGGSMDNNTASSTAEQTGGQVAGAGNGEDPTQRSSGAAPTPANTPSDNAPAPSESAGVANAGKEVFAGNCAACHGAEGQGAVGPSLQPTVEWDDTQFTAALREGKAPDRELNTIMPRFTEAQLSAQQVADVHAYIKTLY